MLPKILLLLEYNGIYRRVTYILVIDVTRNVFVVNVAHSLEGRKSRGHGKST